MACRGRLLAEAALGGELVVPSELIDPAIARFLDAVWTERGLSRNTLAIYRANLTALARHLADRNVPLMQTSRMDLLDFLACRVRAGVRPRSTAGSCRVSSASSATSCARA